jgi:uncharacterized protein (TIGR02118 family)
MVKLTFCLRRAPHLTRDAFQRYWREEHAPLVQRHAATLGIRRYVQLHTVDHSVNAALSESRGGPDEYPEPFDGVAELWWDSVDALAAASATPEGRAASLALLEDERRFIDLGRSPIFVGEEATIIP